jgi:hypothetical protein
MDAADACVVSSCDGRGGLVVRIGIPLVDVYLEFLGGRCRPNTVLRWSARVAGCRRSPFIVMVWRLDRSERISTASAMGASVPTIKWFCAPLGLRPDRRQAAGASGPVPWWSDSSAA